MAAQPISSKGDGKGDGGDEGFSYSGRLEETDVRSLYAVCQSLRFSGRLELYDEHNENRARVEFVGGDPVDIVGGDTQRIALFSTGTFKMEQRIPDLAGKLSDSIELFGLLSQVKPARLWAWVSECRMTCEVELVRPPDTALVVFANGHAESAVVNGQPELAALARVSSWSSASSGAMATVDKAAAANNAQAHFRVRLRPLFGSGMLVVPPLHAEPHRSSEPHQFDFSRSIELPMRAPPAPVAPAPPAPARRGWLLWFALGVVFATGGATAAAFFLELPPFAKKVVVRPLVERPPEPETKPEAKPEIKPETKPETKPEAKPEADARNKERADKLVLKARLLLVEGHEHTALEVLHKAAKLNPAADLATYEQQALGKLGRAEVVLDGKTAVTIDGHRFTPPRRLKLPAGPHTISYGDAPESSELTLRRGEKKKLKGDAHR